MREIWGFIIGFCLILLGFLILMIAYNDIKGDEASYVCSKAAGEINYIFIDSNSLFEVDICLLEFNGKYVKWKEYIKLKLINNSQSLEELK